MGCWLDSVAVQAEILRAEHRFMPNWRPTSAFPAAGSATSCDERAAR